MQSLKHGSLSCSYLEKISVLVLIADESSPDVITVRCLGSFSFSVPDFDISGWSSSGGCGESKDGKDISHCEV